MPSIVLDGISLQRDGGVVGLNDVSLRIDAGELLTVVGPSGSGKTTLLRVIAGLDEPTAGRLLIDGADMKGVGSAARDVAMVFQDHALYSHKTAQANLAFPLEVRHVGEPERSSRVGRMASALHLDPILDRLPKTLSLGQRNAVATGRALVRDPAILLLDEPLANFDAAARLRARIEVRRRHMETGATTVYATNDQEEAMALGDRTVVLNRGMVQQVDAPATVYEQPANLFVARFVGSPPMNAMPGLLDAAYPDYVWAAGNDRLTIPTRVIETHPRLHEFMGRQVVLAVRPEHVRPARTEPFEMCLHGTCLRVEDHGDGRFAHVDLGHAVVVARLEDGGPVPGVGNPTELGVCIDRLHFFDLESGAAL